MHHCGAGCQFGVSSCLRGDKGVYGNSLYFPFNFAVKLIYFKSKASLIFLNRNVRLEIMKTCRPRTTRHFPKYYSSDSGF